MKFKLLDTAVLNRNLPTHGLRRGDVGAVVEIHSKEALEVEFVLGSGVTQALVTLRPKDLRTVRKDELLSVRPVKGGGPRRPIRPRRK
jgi:hypothetical protein